MNDIIHVFFSSDQHLYSTSWWTCFATIFLFFSMDYTYFLSIQSSLSNKRHEPNGVEKVPTSSIWCQLPFHEDSFVSYACWFFRKNWPKIPQYWRYITIYRDIVSQLIGVTYRDKIVDIVPIYTTWVFTDPWLIWKRMIHSVAFRLLPH